MTPEQTSYLIFGIVLVMALAFDLGFLSKKSAVISIKESLWISIFWIVLGLGFGVFVWFEDGENIALEYFSAYLTEKSLSIDNIFVFIIIFNFFNVKEQYYARALLIGVLLAVVLRVIFITVGVELVNRFDWILYIFGLILLYTGVKMFRRTPENEFDPGRSRIYLWIKKVLPVTMDDGGGKYVIRSENGRPLYTSLFVVVVMLAAIDIVFAVDSIPAVMGISKNVMVIYTSNIFAVLGLRALFFLLRGAVKKFEYLQQGIAVILIFIGLKMLAEIVHIKIPVYVSLMVIVLSLVASIIYSIQELNPRKNNE